MAIFKKQRVFKHLSKVGISLVTVGVGLFFRAPDAMSTNKVQSASKIIGVEGGTEALNLALKVAGSKPSLAIAATITCLACVPVAGVAASPAMCIACGVILSKTLGWWLTDKYKTFI